jgi:hypothetical protein
LALWCHGGIVKGSISQQQGGYITRLNSLLAQTSGWVVTLLVGGIIELLVRLSESSDFCPNFSNVIALVSMMSEQNGVSGAVQAM